MNYQIDYGSMQLPTPGRSPSPDAPLFAAVEGRAASLSNSECVFQPAGGDTLEVMTHQVLQALDQCREFRTMDEHIARVVSVIPGLSGQGEAVRRVLGGLVERGLLRSDEQFLATLRDGAAASPAPLQALVVRACDRPAQVERLLSGIAEHAGRFGRRDPVYLIDDSRNNDAVKQHRRLLDRHAGGTGVPVHYIGSAQANALAGRLARSHPEARDALAPLLQLGEGAGFGGGRGYNLALLLTAGRRLVMLDDDYALPFHRLAHGSSGLEPDPWTGFSTRFLDGNDQALVAGEPLAEDGFALQEALVGRSFGQILADQPGLALTREQLRGLSMPRLNHLRGHGRVLATYTGSRGSSFTSDNTWLYSLDKASREDFWRDRDSYLRHLNADHVVFAPERTIARPYGQFTPFMLDNAELLPCTAPTGRGEDSLFSVAAAYLYPDSLTLHLPITIGHVQEGRRPRQERGLQAMTPDVNRFLREWVRNQTLAARSADAGDRLQLLAAQLTDLANAPVDDRVAMLSEYLRYVRADLIERVQQQIAAAPEAPVYWVADARAIVEANGRALLANGVPRLDEWPQDIDANGCAERLSAACLELAAAWRHWPALWRTAAEQGERLLPGS